MLDKVFIDTNIFVYAKIESSEILKNEKAIGFLRNIQSEIVISTQVLSELYNTLSRYKILESLIRSTLLEIIQDISIAYISLETIKKSWDIKEKYKYSYYDSLIIASALESNCSILYTEDLSHEQKIENSLKIINPIL